jgi:hypothetical protein
VQVRGSARQGAELAVPGSVVGVDMRRNNGFDAKPVVVCKFNVVSDLKLRIDDRGAALTASTQKVRGAAGFRFQNLAKDHSDAPIIDMAAGRGCVSRMRMATMRPEPRVRAATAPIAASCPRA